MVGFSRRKAAPTPRAAAALRVPAALFRRPGGSPRSRPRSRLGGRRRSSDFSRRRVTATPRSSGGWSENHRVRIAVGHSSPGTARPRKPRWKTSPGSRRRAPRGRRRWHGLQPVGRRGGGWWAEGRRGGRGRRVVEAQVVGHSLIPPERAALRHAGEPARAGPARSLGPAVRHGRVPVRVQPDDPNAQSQHHEQRRSHRQRSPSRRRRPPRPGCGMVIVAHPAIIPRAATFRSPARRLRSGGAAPSRRQGRSSSAAPPGAPP